MFWNTRDRNRTYLISLEKIISILSTINNISNLIALCRNHHWELDRGWLQYKHTNEGIVFTTNYSNALP